MSLPDRPYRFEGPDGPATLLDLFEGRRQLIVDRFKAGKGWTFPWYSSHGSDFNYDFHVTLDEAVAPVEYNYRSAAEWAQRGLPDLSGELHGTSAFLRDGDRVFHTYSTYGRGTEQVGGTHYYLDMPALGRQEDWEEPRGRAGGGLASPAGWQ